MEYLGSIGKYNPIITNIMIPEEYNPSEYSLIGKCLDVRCNPWILSGLFDKLAPFFKKRIIIDR